MSDDDVRDMLARRAGDVSTSPDAWERIAERIGGGDPAPVTGLASRRPHLPGPPFLLGAAAAALLLVVAAAAVLGGGDGGETVRAADGPSTTSTAPDPAPTTAPPAVPVPSFEAAAEQAARDWVEAIGAGDLDRAWDLLADKSREAARGRESFQASRRALVEEWGAWAGAPGVTYRAATYPGLGSDEADLPAQLPRLAVVILTGTVAQEGTTAFRAVSLPVRGTADTARVEPFTDVGMEIEPGPRQAGSHPRIPGATVLGAFTPAAARVVFVLDDREPVGPDDVEGADGDQQYVTFTPKPPLTPGRHTLTVAVLTAGGLVASRSVVYTVAADAPPATMHCGQVAFTPNSEDAAGDITVTTGTSCDEARAFVEVAGRQTSSGGPDGVDVDGFRCVRTASADEPLPTSTYRCTRGATIVTFVRS